MAAFKFSGGLGGRSASGRSWRQGGYREGRIYADGGSEEDERNVVPSHHEWQLQGQGRQRASAGAAQRMNSSPSTTSPGTMSPSQPQRMTPGVRMFGQNYTWNARQEVADQKDPNFNKPAGDTLKQPAAAAATAKPSASSGPTAPTSSAGQLGLEEGESYGTIAAEVSSAGAGNKVFQAAAATAVGGLVRAGGAGNFAVDAARGLARAEGTLGSIEARPGITYTPPAAYADKMTVDQAKRNGDTMWRSEKLYDQRMSEMLAKVLADPEGMSKTYRVDKWGFKLPREDLNAGLEEQQQAWAKEYQTEITPVDLGKAAVPLGRPMEPWTLEGPPTPDRKKGSGFLVW